MDEILAQNKPLDKYTVKELRMLCSSTHENNIWEFRRLKKKDLYERIITENIYGKYTIQREKKEEAERRMREREIDASKYEQDLTKAPNSSIYIKVSDIEEEELAYGDYPDEWKDYYKKKDDKERKEFLKSAFNLKDSDFKFGNYICFSTYRQTGLIMIGMDDTIIDDFGDYGYELPLCISKYLTDAVNTFKILEFNGYNLHKNDYTVRSTIEGDLPDDWTYYYDTFDNDLVVTSDKQRFRCNKNTKYNAIDIMEHFNNSCK